MKEVPWLGNGTDSARTHARTLLTAGVSLALFAACTAQNPELPPGPGEFVSAQQQAMLPFTCNGSLTRLPLRHYRNLDVDVTPYFCLTNGRPSVHRVDAMGKEWSPDALRLADAAAFHSRFHRLSADLRARIVRDGESTSQLADVWFPTPLAADEKVPPKDQLLALSKAEQKSIIADHNAAIAARAHDVAAMIQRVAPGASIHADSLAFTGGGPLLQVEARPADLRAIGDQQGIQYVGLSLRADEDRPTSTAWFDAGGFGVLQAYGADGDGVSVADVLGVYGLYDTRYLGAATGSCDAPLGPNYNCFCVAGAPHADTGDSHMQYVMSIVKNTWQAQLGGGLPSGGAQHATMLADSAGTRGPGTTYWCGTVTMDDLVAWAVNNGASVINRSAVDPDGTSRYLDYVATAWPYPTVVASSGNFDASKGQSPKVQNHPHNGPVVGAVDDYGSSSRYLMTMADFSCWQNTDANELPHLVAPGVNIDVVGDDASGNPVIKQVSGTSFAAPQVSGAVASLQEAYFGLGSWPEGTLPILLVSSWTAGEPGGPDGTILSLDDSVDDHDGAGELSASEAWQVSQYRETAGNVATSRGFDYRYDWPGDWAQYTMSPTYYASAGAFGYLRVATLMMNHPSCNSDSNCAGANDNFPEYYLYVYDRATGEYWWSVGLGNNYKYLAIHNTHSTTQTYEISAWMSDWKNMSGDTWGLAWDSL